MNEMILTPERIALFETFLQEMERSAATIEKYLRDVRAFFNETQETPLTKEKVIAYKQKLIADGYAVRSVNSMLASLNSFFSFFGWEKLKVRMLKVQQEAFCPEEKELTRGEYERLCRAAEQKKNHRIALVLQTICSMGIRVGELQFITAEAVKRGQATVSLKGKTRTVFIPKDLRKKLQGYLHVCGITTGSAFITRTGKPMNRTNIWREMKNLCKAAGVDERKVFPHNLRHLFARIFYGLEKDIVKLADILGHSSINTTRIYIISTGTEHRKRIDAMHLII